MAKNDHYTRDPLLVIFLLSDIVRLSWQSTKHHAHKNFSSKDKVMVSTLEEPNEETSVLTSRFLYTHLIRLCP